MERLCIFGSVYFISVDFILCVLLLYLSFVFTYSFMLLSTYASLRACLNDLGWLKPFASGSNGWRNFAAYGKQKQEGDDASDGDGNSNRVSGLPHSSNGRMGLIVPRE